MSRLVSLFVIIFSCQTYGQVSKEDFAMGISLETDKQAAIYSLQLPAHVYQTVVFSDLRDLRVVNGNDEIVPHALLAPDVQSVETVTSYTVPFFPVPESPDNLIASGRILIRLNEQGSVLRIESQTGNSSFTRGGYLIDMTAVEEPIDELVIEVSNPDGGFINRGRLRQSNDLTSWTTLEPEFSLAQLEFMTQILSKNTITLDGLHSDYILLDWTEGNPELEITSITANSNNQQRADERQWLELTPSIVEDKPDTYQFSTGGYYPVDRLNLALVENNTLFQGILSSSNETNTSRRVYSGLFYHIVMDGVALDNPDIQIARSVEKTWYLDITTPDGIGGQLPRLKAGWRPHELFFMARGEGPFTLVFGNFEAEIPEKPVADLLRVLTEESRDSVVAGATTGELETIAGADALSPRKDIPWQRILLWAILVIGVVVVAAMAYRLYRQINASEA